MAEPRRRKSLRRTLLFVLVFECCILLLLGAWALRLLATNENDPVETLPSETSGSTHPDPTVQPTVAQTVPPQQPTDPEEMVGTLYTRKQLEAMSTKSLDYGPGVTSDGKRPPYPDDLQKQYGRYGANFIAPETNIVYLTFDCGYEYSFVNENGKTVRVTEWILDTLEEKNVKAVFFVTLPYCKNNPDLVERMIAQGHAVGNHSSTHPSSMAKISIDQMVDEVMTLHHYVKEHFGYEMHLFRPPTGAYSEQSLAVVQSIGYKTVHWSFAYADWDPEAQPSVTEGYNIITGRHHQGAIYLLHAVSATNATVLSDVIDFLQEKDYQLALFE